MSVKRNEKIFPWVYHGGPMNLGSLMKQVIEITITFPHTGTEGEYTCTPVTVNLSTDIGITSNSRVYAVNWMNSDETTTITNTMNSYKHEFTFELNGTQASYTKTYQITLYGDPLLPHQDYEYGLGDGDSGYRVSSRQVSLTKKTNAVSRLLNRAFSWDETVPSGARISRAFFGDKIVFGKIFAGATLKVDIELTGNDNIVRFVNPLVKGHNDWNNRKTDAKIEWGDGSADYIVNRYINSGLCNTDSDTIIQHRYQGTSGQRFTISITSVEPLLPIGCKVTALYGSLPEDCYTESDNGFINYDSIEIGSHSFRAQLNQHRSTISRLGSDLCDNWVRTTRMHNTFKDWTNVLEIPQGFFKPNILGICEDYDSTFAGMLKLSKVDPLLLGKENNVVREIYNMFFESPITNSLELESAANLELISGIFGYTKVTSANKFLLSAPKLKTAAFAFENSLLNTHNESMFGDSELLEDVSFIFKNSKMTNTILDLKKYTHLAKPTGMYAGCPLDIIKTDTFGGNFAVNVPDGTLDISAMFANIGTDEKYTVIEPGAFQPLNTLSVKLKSRLTSMLDHAKIDRLHDDMFKSVFKSDTPRFELINWFVGLKTKDEFGYDRPCVNIPKVLTDCNGIGKLINCFGSINIGKVDSDLFSDLTELVDVTDTFKGSYIHTRNIDTLFTRNLKIAKWNGLFKDAVIKYNNIPLDYIIHSNVESVDITDMLTTANDIMVYRLFSHSSKVQNVNTSGSWIKNKQSLPVDIIMGNKTNNISDKTFDIRPMVFDIAVMQDNTVVTFTPESNTKCAIQYDIDSEYMNDQSLPTTHAYNKGHHRISVICDKSVKLTGDNFSVVRLSGEYPYNSQPDLTNCNHYKLREIDRNVFAVCNHAHIHNNPYFVEYIPILHKDIFKYHDDVTSSSFFNLDKYKLKGMYGIQPGVLDHMIGLTSIENIYSSEIKVLTPRHIPNNLALTNKTPELISHESTSPVVITGNLVNNSITDYSITRAQVISNKSHNIQKGRPESSYLEFYLEGFNGVIKLVKLLDEPTFPITVEVLSKSILGAQKTIINTFDDTINISGNSYVRVYSDKPVWIDQKDKITELYGSIPPCEWTYKMKDMCSNLRRIGDKLLISITNRSIRGMFSGLSKFEYFPGTLLWCNHDIIDYEESFADCPKLFKVDDYIITAKNGNDINCRNMFRNSGVISIRKPIMDDIGAKVNIDGMLSGCKTKHFYGFDNIDREMFKNIDIVGNSGIVYDGGSIKNDNDRLYIETSSTNISGIQSSYYIDNTILSTITDNTALRFASQSIAGQVLPVDRTKITAEMTKYLPFVYKTSDVKIGNMLDGLYDYMEYISNITTCDKSVNNNFIRNRYIVDITSLYKDITFNNTDIRYLLPQNMRGLKYSRSIFENTKGIVIPGDYKFTHHILTDMAYGFKNTNYNISKGIFNNVELIALNDNSVIITELCKNNKVITDELGVFKAYNAKLKSTGTVGIYAECDNMVNIDDDMYNGCEQLELIDYHFSKCIKLAKLPTINHMTKLTGYQHAFEMTNIEGVPKDYIYTTRTDKDIMIDYIFANCPSLFIMNKFIDSRSQGRFSIDFSLNEVPTILGDDPEIFGHVNYDDEYEHRSRVIPFDDKTGWTQVIRVEKENQTASIKALQLADLVGYRSDNLVSIIWGDDSKPVTISPGTELTSSHINHVYKEKGDYIFKVMIQDVTAYMETITDNIITTGLPTNFKFGSINDVKAKGLSKMFGKYVESISNNLFDQLADIDRIEVYQNMFTEFTKLKDLPVGILDCMPNLTNIDGLLQNTKDDGTEITLKAGLIDKLTKLNSFKHVGYYSNIADIEQDFFKSQHSGIVTIANMLANSKCRRIPVTLLNPLINLTDVMSLLRNASSFILDETYNDLFKTNTKINTLDHAFRATQIKGLGSNMLNNIGSSLISVDSTFAINDNYDPNTDSNDWSIPDGFMSKLTGLTKSPNMFRGRKSLKSYPVGLLDSTKATLNNSSSMFRDTGISQIHQGTITGKTINMDASYMFYGCIVRNCPKVVTSCTSTIKTLGMLKGASGEMTEEELFNGIKTDPSDIQSMYKQEFQYFYMDVTLDQSEEIYVKPLEDTLPWSEYVIDILYGDKLVTITENISSADQLKTLTKVTLPAGNHTIGIKAPFATELNTVSGNVIKYNKLYGIIGKMKTTSHIQFKDTTFSKVSNTTISGSDFYKYNGHLTSISSAFVETKIQFIETDVFKYLTKVTNASNAFKNNTVYSIKDGYKPNYSYMKLTDISFMYENCSAFKPNKDYEPFKDITTIAIATNVFARSGIIVTPRVNTTSLTNAQGMYWTCSELTTTYADILDGANKCSNFYGVFGHNPKLTTIEGESDTKTIMSDINPSVSSIDMHESFIDTGLSYQQVIRIVNNLGVFKSSSQISINCTDMFSGTIVRGTTKGSLKLNINTTNKSINATRMFYNCGMNDIPKDAIRITGSLTYDQMFYNCFADKTVQYLDQVFKVSEHNANTDYRSSELDTLNVFELDITSSEASVINLKYVGAVTLENVRYVEVKVGDNNSNSYFTETVDELNQTDINIPAGTTKLSIYSVPLMMPVRKSGNFDVSGVNAHLSTHRDNYVDWSTKFSFGTYYGNARTFNIRLGGQFYVKDGEFYTLNGIFKGMKYITSYPSDIFIDYKGGTVDGVNPIVGIIETFADNITLNSIDVGMLQYISGIQSIRRAWYNTNISEIKDGTFATCNKIKDTYEAFGNTKVNKLPQRLIVINA